MSYCASGFLASASKKSSFDKKEPFFEKTDDSVDDVYRCLSFFDRQKENLPVWLNDKIKENYGRDASLIYYDVTNYYFESDGQNDFLSKDYLFDYYDEVLRDIGAALGIDFSKRIRTLGEIKCNSACFHDRRLQRPFQKRPRQNCRGAHTAISFVSF